MRTGLIGQAMSNRRAAIALAIGLLTAGNVSAQDLVPDMIASPPPEPAGATEIALQETDNAVPLLPMSQDAVVRSALEEDLARVEAQLLRLHPYWDPLRGDQ